MAQTNNGKYLVLSLLKSLMIYQKVLIYHTMSILVVSLSLEIITSWWIRLILCMYGNLLVKLPGRSKKLQENQRRKETDAHHTAQDHQPQQRIWTLADGRGRTAVRPAMHRTSSARRGLMLVGQPGRNGSGTYGEHHNQKGEE